MVTKPPSKKEPKKRASKTRTKKTAKKTTKKRAAKASAKKKPARKATVKKRASKASDTLSRPTQPAKLRAKRKPSADESSRAGQPPAPSSVPAATPMPIPSAPAVSYHSRPSGSVDKPEPRREGTSRPTPSGTRPPRRTYLEGVPRDHADLVAGLIQVVRGAAKDLRTLVTHAISMSHHKDDRSDR
jgi:hypothetical protein